MILCRKEKIRQETERFWRTDQANFQKEGQTDQESHPQVSFSPLPVVKLRLLAPAVSAEVMGNDWRIPVSENIIKLRPNLLRVDWNALEPKPRD